MKNNKVKLPPYVTPDCYQLFIKPDLERFSFEGEETIFLRLEKSVNQITLHSKELEIYNISYGGIKGSVKYDVKAETATLSFARNLAKGKGRLKLNFKGILNDQMRGFYRSKYKHQGKDKHMATTQFEATDARRAFPCFDEPAQKAVFDVTLMVPKDLTAISNTIESEVLEHEGNYKIVNFAPTPKMSTYLLAFIVGDFEFIEGKTKDGVLVRVFVTPGKKHQAKFALSTSIKVLEFYNKYFDIPYPLPVLDLIAIPDFSHGAMENWGAVTYRESALLVDPEHSSAANKQWVALVIAHELAHQWFGNLVTMQWWTHLWLNEGFASYIEYLAVNELFPKWDIWTQFAYNDLNVALELDSLKHTHPIEIEVGHPDEIGEIFDEISYSKGASVIRMLAAYIGEKNFRDGLRYYLKKHAYGNASTEDLWRAFEKASKKPVEKIMKNWTAKPGFPAVRVIEEKNKLLLKQERFFSSPLSKKLANDKTLWQVPVKIKGATSKSLDYLLSGKQLEVTKPKTGWVKINSGETGFYLTEYPSQMLATLRPAIKAKKLPAIDRLGIIRNAFALSQAGLMPSNQVLELLHAYDKETDYTTWILLTSGLADLKNLLFGSQAYPDFEQYARSIFKDIGKEVGWQAKKTDGHTQTLLRALVLSQLVGYNDPSALKKAGKIFRRSKNVPADVRSVVYHAVAQTGGLKQHRDFIKRYNSETLSEEKNRIGRALGQFKGGNILKKTLDFALSKNVRIQDAAAIFNSVWANPAGRNVAWNYTKKNWPVLLKRYPASGHILNRFIKPAARFIEASEAKDVAAFFKKHSAPGAERAIAQVLEKIYSNDAWLKRDGRHLESWLRDHNV